MLKFSADVTVNHPVEKVFAWLTNADNQGKFDRSSLKMEDEGPDAATRTIAWQTNGFPNFRPICSTSPID